VAPPATPLENKPNKSGPDSTKAETAVEKPKHERPADLAPKVKEQPPTRDEGKKQKKNEPATAPTP